MPRIATLDLNQINRQFDLIDSLQAQVGDLQQKLKNVGQSVNIADPIHAPQTTNNLIFSLPGASQISWAAGFIKDKNWSAQTLTSPSVISSAKGQAHVYAVPTGLVSTDSNGNPIQISTFYWAGWDYVHQQMIVTQDCSLLHGNYNVHILCQFKTPPARTIGVPVGGGGINGGVDLSGLSYNLF